MNKIKLLLASLTLLMFSFSALSAAESENSINDKVAIAVINNTNKDFCLQFASILQGKDGSTSGSAISEKQTVASNSKTPKLFEISNLSAITKIQPYFTRVSDRDVIQEQQVQYFKPKESANFTNIKTRLLPSEGGLPYTVVWDLKSQSEPNKYVLTITKLEEPKPKL